MNAEALSPVVVDAGLVVKWLCQEADSALAHQERQRWQTQGFAPLAPDFLLIELYNVLWKKTIRGELTRDAPILSHLSPTELGLTLLPFEPLLPLAWDLSVTYRISMYDALYAGLAFQLRAPLYTTDERLATQIRGAIPVHTLAPLPTPS